jgi:hypothetical protein
VLRIISAASLSLRSEPLGRGVLTGGPCGTTVLEARGASRGNAWCGSKAWFPSACAAGFEAGALGVINVNHQKALPQGLQRFPGPVTVQ